MRALHGIVESLRTTVQKIPAPPLLGRWVRYYTTDPYSEPDQRAKQGFIEEMLSQTRPQRVCDLGSNTGMYSRLAAKFGAYVIAVDNDWASVEENYRTCLTEMPDNVLPMRVDLANPSPGLGWAGKERMPFGERATADTVLVLALVHHLVIGNNISFQHIAEMLATITRRDLVIEFIEPQDPQVQRLMQQRETVGEDYSRSQFERAFFRFFKNLRAYHLPGGTRTLYWMRTL